jgi:hypothetical protein
MRPTRAVLPAPVAPRIPTVCPASISRSIPRRTSEDGSASKEKLTFSNVIRAPPVRSSVVLPPAGRVGSVSMISKIRPADVAPRRR